MGQHDVWKYQPVLNACLQILFSIALGVGLSWAGVVTAERDVSA
jgi:hypothetical protein